MYEDKEEEEEEEQEEEQEEREDDEQEGEKPARGEDASDRLRMIQELVPPCLRQGQRAARRKIED